MNDPLVYTERDLFAIIGELFVRNQMAEAEVLRLRAQLSAATVVSSTEGEGDAEREP